MEAKRSRMDSSISALGQKLLEGWVMLADYCPRCKVPLVQHRHNDERLCVSCGGRGEEGDAAPTPNTMNSTPNGEYALDAPHADDAAGAGNLSPALEGPLSPARPEPAAGARSAGNASAANPPGLVYPPPPIPGQERAGASVAPSSSATPAKKDASQLIADKLLSGWALLDAHCPRCLTPLVRNKQRRMLCVSCDLFVVTEEELKKQQDEEQAQRRAAAGPEPGPGAAAAAAAAASAPGPRGSEPQPAPPTPRPPGTAANTAAGRNPAIAPRAAPAASPTSQQTGVAPRSASAPHPDAAAAPESLSRAAQSALDAVASRMAEYSHRLQGQAVHPLSDIEALDVILKCAELAERLRGLL